MNVNNSKQNEKKTKKITKKQKYKSFKNQKPLRNIDNNTSYDSSDTNSNSSQDIKNNVPLIKEVDKLQDKKNSEKKIEIKGKENNIKKSNKNVIAPFQGLELNKEIQSYSHNNIFLQRNLLLNPINPINNQQRLSIAQVTRLPDDSKINLKPNNINNLNPNIINNNNLNNIQALNYNNPNQNLMQPYNLHLLNSNQLLYNNNLIINPNLNPQLLNNNLIPRSTNIVPFLPTRLGIGLNGYNPQILVNNNNQQRLTSIPITNRYSLDKNNNSDNERLTLGNKGMNPENIMNASPKQNNNLNMNPLLKQGNFQPKNPNEDINKNNLITNTNNNYNNINLNKANSLQLSNQSNRSSIDSLINQVDNNNIIKTDMNFQPSLSNNNIIKTDMNFQPSLNNNNIIKPNMNFQPLLNPTIVQNNNNYTFNNILNNQRNLDFNTINPNLEIVQPIEQSTNQLINQAELININNFNNQASILTIPQTNQNEFYNSELTDYFNQLTNNPATNPTVINNYNQAPINDGLNGKILLKDFGSLSRPGNDESGMTKANQDSYFSKTNINGLIDFNIFGVLDGHGPEGHFVSEFASEFIPNEIINHPEISMDSNSLSIYNKLRRNNYQIIKRAFILADIQLKKVNFDSSESGTTCNLIIHISNHLICANVGDSRAIVAISDINDPNLSFLRAIPLSIDYKPELPEEQSRILMSGGVVRQARNEFGVGVGPYRVFGQGKDYPGLAMSRSIGDLDAKNFGVIAEPGIKEFDLSRNIKFVILCSDGVWEFLSNDRVKDIGRQFYLNGNATGLCQELITLSVIEWKSNDCITDDITVIAIFF